MIGQTITHCDSRFRTALTASGESRGGAKNGDCQDCHQFAPRHGPRNEPPSLKRIGWLYPIFRDVYFCRGLLRHLGRGDR